MYRVQHTSISACILCVQSHVPLILRSVMDRTLYACTVWTRSHTHARMHTHHTPQLPTPAHLSLSARSIVFSAAVSLYSVLPSSVTISRPERYSANSSSSSLTRLRSAPSCWLAWSWLTITCSKGNSWNQAHYQRCKAWRWAFCTCAACQHVKV